MKKIGEGENNLLAISAEAKKRFVDWKTAGGQGQAELPKLSLPKAISELSFDDKKEIKGGEAVAGKKGQALKFSGDTPYSVGDDKNAIFHRTDEFSFSIWLKPAVFKSWASIFESLR